MVWLVDSGNLKKKPVKYLSIFLLHYTPPPHYTALAYHPTITKLNHLALMHFTYATDVANTTHVLRICNICRISNTCRICNTCASHMQHMLHMQHIFTKFDFFSKVPDEIFFTGWMWIPAHVDCTKLMRNLQ